MPKHVILNSLKRRGKSSIYYATIVDALYNAEDRPNIHFIACV